MKKMTFVELKLFLRDPTAVFFGLFFPTALLLLNGLLPFSKEASEDLGGLRGIDIVTPIMVGMAIALVAITVLPVHVAQYRERGVLRRMAVTPFRPFLLLVAQVAVQLCAILVSVGLVILVGWLAFDVSPPKSPLAFVLSLVLGVASLFSVGFLVAARVSTAKSAQGIGSLVFFPMLFFAGVFFPVEFMPEIVQRIGDFTPLGAVVQAMRDSWTGASLEPLNIAVMIGMALIATPAALRLFRWE
ncbi:ABC transporter permease [Rhizohabitans arisaemae]|uniref:ABC transporter permease n=1 Tax=Rhizohabitans arisaemae TaxID=2720610 RepID=UPI0024B2099F|nr:ABC transporter permease [Rhizohabitans arisaemae]